MPAITYKRQVLNDNSELRIAYRCSDEYLEYAPGELFSVLANKPDLDIYIYIVTDGISEPRWRNIQKISRRFRNNEVIVVIPDEADISRLQEKSRSYHGWGLIYITVYYRGYFSHLKKLFSFGMDSYCVGNLGVNWDQDIEGYHLVGNNKRHQKRSLFKSSSGWIGMDVPLIHLEQIRKEGITPIKMERYKIGKIGNVHDEEANNGLCSRKFIELEYVLPKVNREAFVNLRKMRKLFVDWFPFGHKISGQFM